MPPQINGLYEQTTFDWVLPTLESPWRAIVPSSDELHCVPDAIIDVASIMLADKLEPLTPNEYGLLVVSFKFAVLFSSKSLPLVTISVKLVFRLPGVPNGLFTLLGSRILCSPISG